MSFKDEMLKSLYFRGVVLFFVIFLAVGCAVDNVARKGPATQYSGTITDMSVYNKEDDVYIVFLSDMPVEYNSFMVTEPVRLILDIAGNDASALKRITGIHKGGVLQVVKKKTDTVNKYTRFEIHLMYPRPYEVKRNKNELIVRFLKPMTNLAGGYNFDINKSKNKIASGMRFRSDESSKAFKKNYDAREADAEVSRAMLGKPAAASVASLSLISSASVDSKTGRAENDKKLSFASLGMMVPDDDTVDSADNSSSGTTKLRDVADRRGGATLKDIKISTSDSFTKRWGGRGSLPGLNAGAETNSALVSKPVFSGNSARGIANVDKDTGRGVKGSSLTGSMSQEPSGFSKADRNGLRSTLGKKSTSSITSIENSLDDDRFNRKVASRRIREPQKNQNLPGNYTIGPADVLEILVWRNDSLSKVVIVRPDGMITLPLMGDFMAAGKTPLELRADIIESLTEYQEVPEVSVIVKEINSYVIYILGEVMRPGQYNLTRDTSLLQAITLSGGFTQFAAKNNIIVLRSDGKKERKIKIRYKDIISGDDIDKNIILMSGDTIIVP